MIKVADFGMTEDMYARNYFRRDRSEGESEEKVPIRWMAPESIENDTYNESTDVVRTHELYIEHGISMKAKHTIHNIQWNLCIKDTLGP